MQEFIEVLKMGNPKEVIKNAEELIEAAVWESLETEDYDRELKKYVKARHLLESINDVPTDLQMEHDRVLSYCLMRISDAQSKLGVENDSALIEKSLELAERSQDSVQIARSSLNFGIYLLNQGQIPEAEERFRRVFALAEDLDDNRDMQQTLGWTLIVRTNILLGKSLYNQACSVIEDAIGILSSIDNYAGLRVAYRLLSKTQQILGDDKEAEISLQLAEKYEGLAKEHHQ